jgi:hypothetical protein
MESLPLEILDIIIQLLDCALTRIRMARVCWSWRAAIRPLLLARCYQYLQRPQHAIQLMELPEYRRYITAQVDKTVRQLPVHKKYVQMAPSASKEQLLALICRYVPITHLNGLHITINDVSILSGHIYDKVHIFSYVEPLHEWVSEQLVLIPDSPHSTTYALIDDIHRHITPNMLPPEKYVLKLIYIWLYLVVVLPDCGELEDLLLH